MVIWPTYYLIVFFLTGECFQPAGCPSVDWGPTAITPFWWISYRWTIRGTDTPITGVHGWWPEKLIHQLRLDFTSILIRRLRGNNSESRLSHSRKSSSPITTWTSMDRWEIRNDILYIYIYFKEILHWLIFFRQIFNPNKFEPDLKNTFNSSQKDHMIRINPNLVWNIIQISTSNSYKSERYQKYTFNF